MKGAQSQVLVQGLSDLPPPFLFAAYVLPTMTLCCLWGRAEPCCLAAGFKNSTFPRRKQDSMVM